MGEAVLCDREAALTGELFRLGGGDGGGGLFTLDPKTTPTLVTALSCGVFGGDGTGGLLDLAPKAVCPLRDAAAGSVENGFLYRA